MNMKYPKFYSYTIDSQDNIIYINPQEWDEFYNNNSNSSACFAKEIIKDSLWNYIKDFETMHLYENIINNVRTYNREVTFPFRCDSPTQRRFLTLTLKPLENNCIEFISRIEKIEERDYVRVFDNNRESSEEMLIVCSMCKKIKLEEYLWEEVETAVSLLKLFEKQKLPMLSHGLCPFCKKLYMEEVEDFMRTFED